MSAATSKVCHCFKKTYFVSFFIHLLEELIHMLKKKEAICNMCYFLLFFLGSISVYILRETNMYKLQHKAAKAASANGLTAGI
jgi:hypothetical protein